MIYGIIDQLLFMTCVTWKDVVRSEPLNGLDLKSVCGPFPL